MHQPQMPASSFDTPQARDFSRSEMDDLFGGFSHPALGGIFIALLMLAMAAL
jgi:hypothetical protein